MDITITSTNSSPDRENKIVESQLICNKRSSVPHIDYRMGVTNVVESYCYLLLNNKR